MMIYKTCTGCLEQKAVEEFNFRSIKKGTRQARCKLCTRQQVKHHYEKNRQYYVDKARVRNDAIRERHIDKVAEYLSLHPCVDCGEDDIICLEFDHVRGSKFRAIAAMLGNFSWRLIEKEIAKCDVRCANCHRRKTAKHFGWRKHSSNRRP